MLLRAWRFVAIMLTALSMGAALAAMPHSSSESI